MQEHLWKNYFHFSRKERIALLVLLGAVLLLIFLPRFFTPQIPVPQLDLVAINSLNSKTTPHTTTGTTNAEINNTPSHLFTFDPNTVTEAGLLQLGLRPKTALTLIHYREKGGRFRQPGDLRKIYGLRPEEADRLMPHVSIPSPEPVTAASQPASTSLQPANSLNQPPSTSPAGTTAPATFQPLARKLSPGKQLVATNINTATAADWKKFPGIGEVLSKRIVAFRNKLGAFQSVYQVQQTYGLPDSVFSLMLPYLYLDTAAVATPAVKTTSEHTAASAFQEKPAPLPIIMLTSRRRLTPLQAGPAAEQHISLSPQTPVAAAYTTARHESESATGHYTVASLQTASAPARYTPALLQTSPATTRYTPAVFNTKPATLRPAARNMLSHKLGWYPVLPIDPSPL